MAHLFDELNSFTQMLGHFQLAHDNWQSTSTKSRCGQSMDSLEGGQQLHSQTPVQPCLFSLVGTIEIFALWQQSDIVQLIDQLRREFDAKGVVGRQLAEQRHEASNAATHSVVCDVVGAVLHVVSSKNRVFSHCVVAAPFEKVDLLTRGERKKKKKKIGQDSFIFFIFLLRVCCCLLFSIVFVREISKDAWWITQNCDLGSNLISVEMNRYFNKTFVEFQFPI
jgi:hypothetical protein